MLIRLATFFLLSLLTTVCWGGGSVEHQIGPFNLADTPMTESKLISQFGEGCIEYDKAGDKMLGKKHIYYVADKKMWLEIRLSDVLTEKMERTIEAVLITKQRLCDERFRPTRTFGALTTGRGITIGDSMDKVLNTYGRPSVLANIGKDKFYSNLQEVLKLKEGRVLRYLGDQTDALLFAEFYFHSQKLHSLLISASE